MTVTEQTTVFRAPEGVTTYYFDRLAGVKPGPWTGEPDKAQWVDDQTGLDCLMVRGELGGALCGYVGVPFEHPLHGADAFDVEVSVHGGLNYSNLCDEANPHGICHIPHLGRPTNVWWFGFDTGHFADVSPLIDHHLETIYRDVLEALQPARTLGDWQSYKNFAYVYAECTSLAEQLFLLG